MRNAPLMRVLKEIGGGIKWPLTCSSMTSKDELLVQGEGVSTRSFMKICENFIMVQSMPNDPFDNSFGCVSVCLWRPLLTRTDQTLFQESGYRIKAKGFTVTEPT